MRCGRTFLWAALLIFELGVVNSIHAQAPYADASAIAGNGEAPEGQDFDSGTYSASASTTDSDPEFGTASAFATANGPSLNTHGTATAYMEPAWIARGAATFMDDVEISFPVASTPSLSNVLLALTFDMSWSVSDNGHYMFDVGGIGSSYDSHDGFYDNQFNLTAGNSGSATRTIEVALNSSGFDPENGAFYLGTFSLVMGIEAGAGSGHFTTGTYGTVDYNATMQLVDIQLLTGPGGTPIPADISGASGADYENLGATADFDIDGDVDGADLLTWQQHSGTTTGAVRMDGNSNVATDGDVDADDLTVWKAQFGDGGATAAIFAAPEPATLTLLAVAGLLVRRRRLT
jgi:hypothetical protein